MRLSADERDPGYRPEVIGRVMVTLDGWPVSKVITADEESGYIECLVLDAAGKPIVAPDGEQMMTETRRGAVAIEIVEVP